jgi:hypothetical protein
MTFASNRLGLLPLAMVLLCGEVVTSSRPARAAADGGSSSTIGDAAPQKALPGPSLSQTGAVGSVGLEGQVAPKTLRAKPRLESRPEKRVIAPKEAANAPGRSEPQEVIPRPIQQQITGHLHGLAQCRRDAARDRHVPTAQLAAGALLLRWTIDVTGTVSTPEVVEQTPVDPAIMDCVKRTIASWTFAPPDKGPLAVERPYQFHHAK